MKPIDPRLLRWAPAARMFLAVSAVIAVGQTAVTIAFAGLLAAGIADAAAGRSPEAWLPGLAPWLAGVVVLRALLLWASETWGARAAAQTGRELRSALLDAIARRGPAWLGGRNRAEIAVTAGHGLDALDPYFSRYIPQLVLTAIATPVIVAVMWGQDWPSGVAAVVTLPLIPLFLILIGIATRTVQRRQLRVLQTLAARFADTVHGLATLRLFGRERRAAARMRETADQYRRETMRVLRYSFLSGFALELLSSLAVAIIAVSVGLRLLDGELSLQVGLFVLLLAPEAFLPLRQVGVQFHAAAEGVAATDGVFEILEEDPSAVRSAQFAAKRPGEPQIAHFKTESGVRLVLHEVAVRYGSQALPPVSVTAEPGTVTLLEGSSGSGKSSLLAALRGAAEYDGSIRVMGVTDPDPAGWLAWAGQRPGLIRGTIAANVALGDAAPDLVRVRAALAAAAAADLDPAQQLGVQGAGLSGGQAQRVAVARAFYRLGAGAGGRAGAGARTGARASAGTGARAGARVLALDEPSSALDAATEQRLWRAVRRAADEGATVLLISHRPSARSIADQIVRLGKGSAALDSPGLTADLTSVPVAKSAASALSERQISRREPAGDSGAEIPVLPGTVRGILRMAMPSARRFLPGVLAGIVSAAAAVGLLLTSGWLIVTASLVDNLVPLSVAIVGVRFFAVTRAVTRYLERLAGHDAALGRLADLRAAVVRRLTPLAPAGLGSTDRGSVLSALVDDVENLQNLPLRVVQPLLTGGVVAVLSVGVLALVSPAAALALAVCLAVAVAGAVVLGGIVGGRAERALSRDRAELSAALVDELTALDVLQAYGAERIARDQIRAADDALRRTVTRAALAQSLSAALVSLAAGAASIWALASAVPGLAGGAADAPWFAVAVLLPMAVFDVFAAVPQAASAWRGVRASAEWIHTLLPDALPSQVRDDEGEGRIGDGVLRVRDLTAAWPGSEAPTLHGIDLDVAPGERILVTGSSGAGKSTLAAVLVGFLRFDGSYRIGESDAGRVPGPELRRHVGLCLQDPELFDEDIRQNLLFARDDATDAELLAVLDRVGLGGWTRERGGLDARVGERGALVSGGQAQRIALARAILRGFPVLVLDEPTAGVDPDASDALLRDLLGAAGSQTVILVSHVAPPAGTVDRTVHLEAGRLVSAG